MKGKMKKNRYIVVMSYHILYSTALVRNKGNFYSGIKTKTSNLAL